MKQVSNPYFPELLRPGPNGRRQASKSELIPGVGDGVGDGEFFGGPELFEDADDCSHARSLAEMSAFAHVTVGCLMVPLIRSRTRADAVPPATETSLVLPDPILQAKSKEEVIAWMRRAPFGEGVTLEVRQVHDPADFASLDPTGELLAKDVVLREQMAANSKRP